MAMRRSAVQLGVSLFKKNSAGLAIAANRMPPAFPFSASSTTFGFQTPHSALFRSLRGVRYMTFPHRTQQRYRWGGSLDPNSTAVVWSLIAANGAVFMLWRTDPSFASKHFVVSLDSLRSGRVWTAVTSAFSQYDFGHLSANMISLFFFGSDVGKLFGGRKLLMLYLAGGLAGSLAHVGWAWYQQPSTRSFRAWISSGSQGALGASAAVNAIVVADILLYPTRTILLYGFIPLPAALLGCLWLWNDLGGALGAGTSPIAHAGHLGGAATGLAFFLLFKRGIIRPF